jgi:hypothetical protein
VLHGWSAGGRRRRMLASETVAHLKSGMGAVAVWQGPGLAAAAPADRHLVLERDLEWSELRATVGSVTVGIVLAAPATTVGIAAGRTADRERLAAHVPRGCGRRRLGIGHEAAV